MATIQFYSADVGIPAIKRRLLRDFLPLVFKDYGKKLVSITYVFCSDEYLLNINKQFLQHDYYTDIISFDLSAHKMEVEAEIYISIERVKDNAKSLRIPLKQELHRVVFHGVLHLCGLKDKTKVQKEAMRIAEENCLAHYFRLLSK